MYATPTSVTLSPRLRRAAASFLWVSALGCQASDPTGSLGGSGGTNPLTCGLEPRYLSLSAAAKDAIASIDDPRWVDPDDPTDLWFLSGEDRVVGFMVDGQAYAVPVSILWYHEITNATFTTASGALHLAVTHCPLTSTSMVFDRAPAGGAEFGVSGVLYQSNLVMYDRNTSETWWPQMLGAGRCGPAQGVELPLHPSIEMRWDGWIGLYPDTKVLASPFGARGSYDTNPYAGYDLPDAEFTFPMPPLDTRLPPKERVLGVAGAGIIPWVYPFKELADQGAFVALNRSFGSGVAEAVVLWDRDRDAASVYRRAVDGTVLSFRADTDGISDLETGSRWTVDGLAVEGPLTGKRLERVEGSYAAFWGAWQAFFGLSRIWGDRSPP